MRSSPAAKHSVSLGGNANTALFARNPFVYVFFFVICVFLNPALFQAQETPATPTNSVPSAEIDQGSAELTTHDEPTKFQVNVKLVVVRVVVRDPKGQAIGDLKKQDFELFDKGKPQVITQFEVEQPGSTTVKTSERTEGSQGAVSSDTASTDGTSTAASAVNVPQRFVTYLFDDVHLEFGDLARVREAAERHFATLRPTDRAAIFTTSGQTNLDFTDDQAKLRDALLHLQPRPINSNSFLRQCPEISFYQADLIVNKNDADARQLAVVEANECLPASVPLPGSQGQALGNATALVNAASEGVLSAGIHESHVALDSLNALVRRMSKMPGRRSIVLASPGFLTPDMQYEYNEIIDHAVRSQVVINALDARGLYVVIPFGDASHQPSVVPGDSVMGASPPPTSKTLMETAAAAANDDLLAALAYGTGGEFFHNNNDFDEGFRTLAETPAYSYVLGFVPQNLKLDGSFHALKIKLNSPQKFNLQARRGYYAPKQFADPDEQAKQEIEDAMYSQEEIHNLPVKLRTQYFKASDNDAKLTVLAHVDVKLLHFRKVENRNQNVLTCVSALFNRNGNFIEGTQKVVTMHLKDETLDHKLAAGITLKTSFDVKPGSYLVRLVVRDAEGQMMSAENGAVEIR
jgi:VWFA-related protein